MTITKFLKGLAEGEKVVTSAISWIDSESRFQAATQKAWRRMISKIIGWSAKNKFLVLILVAVAVVGSGLVREAYPAGAIPDLSDTQ